MNHLRKLTIIWLLALTILFNIEKLDIGAQNVINIDAFVYLLGLIAVASIIAIPALHRLNGLILVVFWIGVYITSKFFLSSRPFFGGLHTYLTITEATLLVAPIWISYRFAQAIHDFESAVMNITMVSNSDRVRHLKTADEDIEVEMFRSRNSHQPLSVVVVEPKPESVQVALHRAVQEVQQTMMYSYVINSMAQRLSKYLRRTDLILEQREQGRFVILCPDTNGRELKLITEYVETIADLELGVSVRCGTATFPDQALTFEDLVNLAQSHLQQTENHTIATPQRAMRRVEAIQPS